MATLTNRTARPACLLVLLAACRDSAAASDGWDRQAGMLVALVCVAALATVCCVLLRRWLRADDRAARLSAELCLEQHARRRSDQALGEARVLLRTLAREQANARDAERSRIARDIHDDLGQNLLALRIELSLMQVQANGIHPHIHQKLGGLIGNLDLAIRSLRAIINDLRPMALEEGLRSAVARQLAEFTRINGVGHEFIVDAPLFDARPGAPELDAMLYRILQEALSNVARHAHASHVRVELAHDGEHVTLLVHDNGVGIAGNNPPCGCGLSGMRERIGAAGGELRIDSTPGAGTLLSLAVPVAHESVAR